MGWWALVVSLASLAVSAATYWRNRIPKPRWVARVRVYDADGDGEVRVTATAENRGRGIARDVRLAYGQGRQITGLSQRSCDRVEFGESLRVTLSFDPGSTGTGSFKLTWCQEPHLHRRRSLRPLTFRIGDGDGGLPNPSYRVDIY